MLNLSAGEAISFAVFALIVGIIVAVAVRASNRTPSLPPAELEPATKPATATFYGLPFHPEPQLPPASEPLPVQQPESSKCAAVLYGRDDWPPYDGEPRLRAVKACLRYRWTFWALIVNRLDATMQRHVILPAAVDGYSVEGRCQRCGHGVEIDVRAMRVIRVDASTKEIAYRYNVGTRESADG